MIRNIEKIPFGKESKDDKEKKISEIEKLGFSDEKAKEYLAKHFKIETLKTKIENLQSKGFKDPVSLIEKHLSIADLDIDRVIDSLKEKGFKEPVSLIEKFPQIADLDIDRIEARINLIKRLNKMFKLSYDPIQIIEKVPRYLSYSKNRIFFYFRIASFYNLDEKSYKKIISQNPFLVFNLLYKTYSSINQLPDKEKMMRVVSKLPILSKEAKETLINKIKAELPQIIENLKQKEKDENAIFLLKLTSSLSALLEKEKRKEK
jgi:uncharacterized tellurite resistance protein B-like protein